MKVQFDIPRDVYVRLTNHPDFPSRRNGRMKFYRDTFIGAIESPPETMIDRGVKRLKKEAEAAKQTAEFWRKRASEKN